MMLTIPTTWYISNELTFIYCLLFINQNHLNAQLLAKYLLPLICFIIVIHSSANSKNKGEGLIVSGIHWYDNNSDVVSAHGAGVLKEGNTYFLFGELKSDTSNAFVGFSCYSSQNLADWKFENIALPTQKNGRLGPQRVGERPKVIKCPLTGEFVMFMHTDDMRYKDPCIGYFGTPWIITMILFSTKEIG